MEEQKRSSRSFLTPVVILLLSVCLFTTALNYFSAKSEAEQLEAQLDEQYHNGYEEGYGDAESSAYANGYDAGYDDALSDNTSASFSEWSNERASMPQEVSIFNGDIIITPSYDCTCPLTVDVDYTVSSSGKWQPITSTYIYLEYLHPCFTFVRSAVFPLMGL